MNRRQLFSMMAACVLITTAKVTGLAETSILIPKQRVFDIEVIPFTPVRPNLYDERTLAKYGYTKVIISTGRRPEISAIGRKLHEEQEKKRSDWLSDESKQTRYASRRVDGLISDCPPDPDELGLLRKHRVVQSDRWSYSTNIRGIVDHDACFRQAERLYAMTA